MPHGVQSYGRQADSGTPASDDVYQADHEARSYPSSETDYQHDAYEHNEAHLTEEDYYDDMPSSRRRLGVMAVAGIFALVVIGTAGAFGYRALFGSSGSPQPPPVITADTASSKIVPATTGKDAPSKLITDRVNERGQGERLVSREEQPVDKSTTTVMSQAAPQAALGSGVVASEPKKVRTIAIHPDQPAVAEAATSPAAPLATAAAAPTRAATPTVPAPAKPTAPPARTAETSTADAEQNASSPPAVRSTSPVRQAAPAPSNSPMSLSPDAPVARAAPKAPTAPTRTASVTAPAQAAPPQAAGGNSGGPGSYVQLSSQRSEAEAQTAFRSLQAKYPNQLGGRQVLVHKADLGAKGTYYRAMVGPFASSTEAGELCSSLKAAGGQCLIQRN